MTLTPTVSRLALIGGLLLVVAVLGWLVFSSGEQRRGVQPLMSVAGAHVEILESARQGLSFAEVAVLPASAWEGWRAEGYASAKPGDTLWVRARIRNDGEQPWQSVLADTSYFSDEVEMWSRSGEGPWQHAIAGGNVAGEDKPLWDRKAAFPMTVAAHSELSVYLRVRDDYIAHVQPMWWMRVSDYVEAQVRSVVVEFLCYGALLSLVFYNFVLWLRLRFADTGYYVLTAAASAALNLIANGVPSLFGWRMTSPVHESAVAAAFAVGSIFMLQFARVFLGAWRLFPRVDVWLKRWRWALIGIAVGVLAMPWMSTPGWLAVAALGSILTDAICLIVSLMAWRRGNSHARFFVLAFGVLGVSAVPLLASVVSGGVLPGTAFGVLGGRTMEMLLLSFAVADRFAQIQRQLTEETEQRRMMQETYADELELEVNERTRELAEANVDKDRMIAVIGHDLRGPLTGLMRTADENQGEFAQTTAKAGRELLLMIEDLVLWARLRAGTRVVALYPARALITPALALHRALAERSGARLTVEVPDHLMVTTDLVLAQTLVRNLLANALKFARTHIVLSAVRGEGGVRFAVGNDGPALPPEVAARFAAGEDEPLTATGGLGLRLCREICRVLETKLEATSGAAGGTEFGFVLRVKTSPEEIS